MQKTCQTLVVQVKGGPTFVEHASNTSYVYQIDTYMRKIINFAAASATQT